MASLDEKIDELLQLAEEIIELTPAACADEAAALKQAGRDLDQARQSRDSAMFNRDAGAVVAGGSVVAGLLCGAALGWTGLGAAGCAVFGATGEVGGILAYGASDIAVDVAVEEMKDQADAMSKVLKALCTCVKSHLPQESWPEKRSKMRPTRSSRR